MQTYTLSLSISITFCIDLSLTRTLFATFSPSLYLSHSLSLSLSISLILSLSLSLSISLSLSLYRSHSLSLSLYLRFEERSKEFDRARVIYKFALENTAKEENVRELNKEFIAFEKRHGNRYGTFFILNILRFILSSVIFLLGKLIYYLFMFVCLSSFLLTLASLCHLPLTPFLSLSHSFLHMDNFLYFSINWRQGIEDAIVSRRREEYEEKVKLNPYDYDAWFDYLRLEETEGLDHDKTRGWNDTSL